MVNIGLRNMKTHLLMIVIALSATASWADGVRSDLFQAQIDVLDGRASSQYNLSIKLQPPTAEVPRLFDTGPSSSRYNGPHLSLAQQAARRYNVPVGLFLRLVRQESGWQQDAISQKGAIGLAQLMPATADLLGVDPHDPAQNLDGGARYLREQFETFGTWQLALAAYNAGPEAVKRYGGIPPYNETQNYVRIIWGG